DPCGTAATSLDLEHGIRSAARAVHLSPRDSATTRATSWVVPAAHFLESWGDARAFDGTVSLIQPLILPLFHGKTIAEVLAVLAGDPHPDARALLVSSWRAERGAERFDDFWHEALRRGVVAGTEAERRDVPLEVDAVAGALEAAAGAAPASGDLEIAFAIDPKV